MVIPRITIDWTFNVGHIITVFIFCFGGLTAWFNLKEKVEVITTKLEYTDKNISRLETNQALNVAEIKAKIESLQFQQPRTSLNR